MKNWDFGDDTSKSDGRIKEELVPVFPISQYKEMPETFPPLCFPPGDFRAANVLPPPELHGDWPGVFNL